MARRIVAVLALSTLAACASAPAPERTQPVSIPAPPPMPAAEIPPGGQPANLGTAHASACTIALFNEVPQQVSGVERIQADDASLTEFPEDAGNIRVAGAGRYYRAASEWEPFRFECLYDTADARISAFDVQPL